MACSAGTPSGPRNSTKRALAHPEAGDADGEHLGDEHCGEERQQHGEAHVVDAQGLGRHQRGQAQRDLVGEPRADHLERSAGVVAQPAHAEVDRADEPGPALGGAEATADAGMVRGHQHRDQPGEGARRDQGGHRRGVAELAQAGVDGQAHERDEGQHQPPGQPFEHHRGERVGWIAVLRATGATPAGRRRRWWWAGRWPRTGRRSRATPDAAGGLADPGRRGPGASAGPPAPSPPG